MLDIYKVLKDEQFEISVTATTFGLVYNVKRYNKRYISVYIKY